MLGKRALFLVGGFTLQHIQKLILKLLDRNNSGELAYGRSLSVCHVSTPDQPFPLSAISKEFLEKIDARTPYVRGKGVSRLEMDSRWAWRVQCGRSSLT